MRIRLIVFLALLGGHLDAQTSIAGPYFNVDSKGLESQSRAAVKLLGDARVVVIQMFTQLDAGAASEANASRTKAVGILKQALDAFKEIEAKAPSQALSILPRNDDEKRVLQEFTNALAARKIPMPKTEKELASIAISMVSSYLTTVQNANIQGFPKNWKGVRQIILSEIDLLTVGNVVSVAWTIREQ